MSCVGCNDGCFDESVQLAHGPAGADGADGDNGTNGLSAYEVAVENGFVGTETDWLNSLVGNNGADAENIVIDHRTSDGGIFLSGGAYFPGIIPATTQLNQQVVDTLGTDLSTPIPANTLEQVGDLLRLRLVGGVYNAEFALGENNGAMRFEIYIDTTLIAGINIGTYAKYALGTGGFSVELDISFVDNALFPLGDTQIGLVSTLHDNCIVGLVNVVGPASSNGVSKGSTFNLDWSLPHTIYIKATNDISDPNIVDLDEAAGAISLDTGVILSYEILKLKK